LNTGVSTNFSSGFKGKKQKDFSHPSVVALLREAGGQSDPESIVREKCRAIVSSKKKGWMVGTAI